MSETGIFAYDLELAPRCEECGSAIFLRLPGVPTECGTCTEIATRHRCTKRPDAEGRETGSEWECPDCGTVWAVDEAQDHCGECGQDYAVRAWTPLRPGDRIDTAPRYIVRWTPFRDLIPRRSGCYRLAGGSMVHVKPGCRC